MSLCQQGQKVERPTNSQTMYIGPASYIQDEPQGERSRYRNRESSVR